ncbi:MAG: GHKL domain-containing protein [Eubacteriales bacterium]
MGEIIRFALILVFSWSYTLIIYELYCMFFVKAENRLLGRVLYVIYFVFTTTTSLVRISPHIIIPLNIVISFCLTLVYRATIKTRVLVCIGVVAALMSIEVAVPVLVQAITGGNINQIIQDDFLSLLMMAVIKVVPYILIKIYKLKKNYGIQFVESNASIPLRIYAMFLIVPVGSIFLIDFLFSISDIVSDKQSGFVLLVVLIVNIIYIQLYAKLLELFEMKYESKILNRQLALYGSQYQLMESKMKEYRELKHNMKHDIHAIVAKLRFRDIQNIENAEWEQWVDDIIGEVDVNYTTSNALNIILNYYYHQAIKEKIKMVISVDVVEEIIIDDRTLCIIVGNLLENALEACEGNDDSWVKIQIIQQYDNLQFRVSNPIYKTLKWEEGIPKTSKEQKNQHGVGLKSVKRIVREKDGFFEVSTKEGTFIVEIIL